MTKRRITLVVDDDARSALDQCLAASLDCGHHVEIEHSENVPEPDRVHEFRIRVVARPCDAPVTADRIARLLSASISWPSNYAVTEVAP